MFTVKAIDSKGHTVKGCDSYRYNVHDHGGVASIHDPVTDTIELFDADGRLTATLGIEATTYVMNANGRTVDTFHATRSRPAGTLIREGAASI